MIMDGKKLAGEVAKILRTAIENTTHIPSLGIVLVGSDPASHAYVRKKVAFGESIGVPVQLITLREEVTQTELEEAVESLVIKMSGVIIQLPLPAHIDTKKILAIIPKEQDVDVLSPIGRDAFVKRLSGSLTPPVPLAILTLLKSYHIDVTGRRVVLVGRGKLVGEPTGIVLGRLGAELAYAERGTKNLSELTSVAHVVIAGAGVSGLITPDMIKDGVVIIDAGTSEVGGKLVGDADPMVAKKASFFAPVPGGVGPLTVAMLFVNLFSLAGISTAEDVLHKLEKNAIIAGHD